MRHIHTDTSDIKIDLRRTNDKRVDGARELLSGKLDHVRDALAGKIDVVRGELFVVKESIASAKIWALSLYTALATGGLLLVMARGFKWL